MDDHPHHDSSIVELAAEIVSAYVSNNSVASNELPGLIGEVHRALAHLQNGRGEAAAPEQKPAVPVKKSVHPDYIVCLDDGLHFKSLKRHLRTAHNISPAEYRAKWGLPKDYPMVAPGYAARRSDLAKSIGLGQPRRPAADESDAKKTRRGRKPAE